MKKSLLVSFALLCSAQLILAQENENNFSFDMSADLVSRYVWRGMLYSPNPNIQPTLGISKGNFSIGAWGSYSCAIPYSEVDLYISYTLGNFSISLNDYYAEYETDLSINRYFQWNHGSTPHALEGSITCNGPERFPISVTAATFFYGNDLDVDGKNYYSTYIEVGYTKQFSQNQLNLFVGATPTKGLYANKAGFVNLGVGLNREIAITDKFNLPVYTQVIINPSAQDVFLVLGITL